MSDQEKKKTKEQLIERRGYLKVPDEFKNEHGTPKQFPNPDAYIETDESANIVRLVYEWERDSKGKLKERGE